MTDIKVDMVPVKLPSCAPDNPAEALSWLGDTVEEVAEGLRARGIKGWQGLGHKCPLASYLQEWWPNTWVACGAYSRAHLKEGDCPLSCLRFELAFDAGKFPDLIAD